VAEYHPAVGGVLNQHGFNLLWIGLATIVGAVFIWRRTMTAIWVTAMVGGLADVGYLLFVDLPGHVNFFPGTVMTLISASAIVLSFSVWLPGRKSAKAA
jgi:CHASE2 domain-containing sensor protein